MQIKKALQGLMIVFYLMAIPMVYIHWICDEIYTRPPEGINRPSYTMMYRLVAVTELATPTVLIPRPPVTREQTIERPRPAGEQSAATTAARHTRPPNGALK